MVTPAPPGARKSPEFVGPYELLATIGEGGMGRVFLARKSAQGGFERDVALKLVSSRLGGDPENAAALLEEAKVAARIRHPNVVPVFDVGEDDAGIYLVMEYVEGDSVAGLVRKGGRLPPEISIRILLDALDGLHAAHELRDRDGRSLELVHRDFSPHNVLVGEDGISRLTDFGIAKSTQSAATKTGMLKGKIGYVSPEQVRGMTLDQRSDVWSAGVVAWELLAGRRLFPALDEIATLMRIVTETPPRVRSVCADIPPALDEAVAAALAPRERRIATVAEFRRRLLGGFAEPAAETREVAAVVRRLAGPMLDERRALIAQPSRITRVRTPITMPDPEPLEPETLKEISAPIVPLAGAAESTALVTETPAIRRRLRTAGAAALVASLCAASLLVGRSLSAKPSPDPETLAVATSASSAPLLTTEPPGSSNASSERAPAAEPTTTSVAERSPVPTASATSKPSAPRAQVTPTRPRTAPTGDLRGPPASRATATGLSLVPNPYEPKR